MIDGHIHIENQPYSIELINNMVKTAIEKGIDEINVLDHSHKFKEFSFLYSSLKDDYSISWYNKKNPISISNYLQFIEEVRKINFPVKINFGLEICYFEDKEDELMNVLSLLPKFDFLIGSVHFVDGIGIDAQADVG